MRENVQIEGFIPIWIQRLLDHRGGVSLLAADSGDGERIGMSCSEKVSVSGSYDMPIRAIRTEHIPLVQSIRSDDWSAISC